MTTKRKLLFVSNNMNIGGVQKALCNLLKEISDNYEITLFLFNSTDVYMNDLPEKIKVLTCKGPYRYFGISQGECKTFTDRIIRGFFAALTKTVGRDFVVKLMNLFQKPIKDEYDFAISCFQNGIKNSFYGGCNDFVLCKTKAKQKITFLHCDYGLCGANYEENNNKYKKFDKIAACSDGCKKAFMRCLNINPQKVFTVNNCNDFDAIRKLADTDTLIYDESEINVITVARLAHEKGIERALEAVRNAVESGVEVKYHLVGDGDKKNELQKLCHNLGIEKHVVFHGNSSNPYKYMKKADLLLVSSYHEAAPMVIDEARCLGVPILSTETTSSQDMIIDNDSGWVCENSQEGISELLYEIVSQKDLLMQKKQQMQKKEVNNNIAVQQFHDMLKN